MPIGGFVVTIDPAVQDRVLEQFGGFPALDVHGVDQEGNAVVVIDTETSAEMEKLTRHLQSIDGVLALGATYFHVEDEIEKIETGEIKPALSFRNKRETPPRCS